LGHLLTALGLGALAVWVCLDPWSEILELAWTNQEYSHILLVPFVAAFLVWVRRLRLLHFRVSHRWLGALLVVTGWAMTSLSYTANFQAGWYAGAVVILVGAVVTSLGKNALFQFLPAAVVLVFLVPFPQGIRQAIALPLQEWTAWITAFLLDLVGVQSQSAGTSLSINGVPLQVAEACNGMRIVFPLILIGYAFSFALPLRNRVRVLLLLASPLIALVSNVVRTIPTVYLYGQDADYGRQFHDFSGWAMVPIAFVVLLLIIKLLRWTALPIERFTLASQAR
jgi:exosortase